MREVDTQEYLSVLKELVEEGHHVSLLISGSSMSPFLIHHRDTIYFKKPDRELKVGDMVFYRRGNGKYIMHRIRWIRPEGFYMIGDAQTETEYGVPREAACAIVRKVKRGDALLTPDSPLWRFYQRAWLVVIPLRPTAVRVREAMRKRK